jgi:hypothetical protein
MDSYTLFNRVTVSWLKLRRNQYPELPFLSGPGQKKRIFVNSFWEARDKQYATAVRLLRFQEPLFLEACRLQFQIKISSASVLRLKIL